MSGGSLGSMNGSDLFGVDFSNSVLTNSLGSSLLLGEGGRISDWGSGKDLAIKLGETSGIKIDLLGAEVEEGTNEQEKDKVQNTVKGSFRIRLDYITTLGKTKGNRVENVDNGCSRVDNEEVLLQGRAVFGINGASSEQVFFPKVEKNHEQTDETKDKVTPLVGRFDESRDQERNNKGLLGSDSEQGSRPRKTYKSSPTDEVWRKGQEITNPSRVENLSETGAGSLSRSSDVIKLGLDISPTQVRSLSKVLKGEDGKRPNGQVVEQALVRSFAKDTPAQNTKSGGRKDGKQSPVPVTTMRGNVEVSSSSWVDLDSFIARTGKERVIRW